jgi:hypothetical protein
MDFWPFVRTLPDEVQNYAWQVYNDGWAEVDRLQKLSREGTSEEKARAIHHLEQLGVPGVWFHRRFTERYPDFTAEQTRMLFAYAARASL